MKENLLRRFKLILALIVIANVAQAQKIKDVKIGGALRFNFRYKDWDENNKDVGGDAVLDVFRLNTKARYEKLYMDAEYRFYPSEFGGGMLHHGFIGYNFNDNSHLELGVHQVPFGIQPFASHSWFFNLPYYVGLEDDYDTGLKYVFDTNKWNFAFAFYKNAEGGRAWTTFSNGSQGNAVDLARYSYDLAGDNEENGQFNFRAARKFNNQEVGFSAQLARYRNHVKDKNYHYNAFALHYHGRFLEKERLDVKFELTRYDYKGADNDLIKMAAYNYTYDIASEAIIICGGVAYTIPVEWGPIESLQVYDNYNYMKKGNSQFNDTQMNVLGVMVKAGPIYTYIDYASGKNQDWLGPWGAFGESADAYGFGRGAANPEWYSWFNVNVGYYF
ncbi:hypothetical protein [Marinifilum fragile]|uniref:hypothetical protein n=1 Tax=Marinifilum fragile TaxID=570161 RepID=UPI002AA7FF39|nr:hypothetical protein [Marinifilum fragile]